jgi:hypothetical protein
VGHHETRPQCQARVTLRLSTNEPALDDGQASVTVDNHASLVGFCHLLRVILTFRIYY